MAWVFSCTKRAAVGTLNSRRVVPGAKADGSSEFVGDLNGCTRHGYLHEGSGIGTKPRECRLGKWINRAFVKGKRSKRLEMGMEWTHQSGTFDCHSELHGYGKRVLPNGVVEQGHFVHSSLKTAVAA